MIAAKLTRRASIATTLWATSPGTQTGNRRGKGVEGKDHGRHPAGAVWMRMVRLVVVSGLAAGGVAGCVTVNAPNKPIVIELNINIKQEVVYRLAADAGKTIDSNKDIF